MTKPILCLDFDGVLHEYTSGWEGARTISDMPVNGAMEFLLDSLEHFDVAILSSRSHRLFGRWAMKRWLRMCLEGWFDACLERAYLPPFYDPAMGTHEEERRGWARTVVRMIRWPKHKPPALLTIDDRAITFTGEWPSMEEIKAFKPWNKK